MTQPTIEEMVEYIDKLIELTVIKDKLKAIRAALLRKDERTLPEGWVLVPRDPDLEMCDRGASCRWGKDNSTSIDIYHAMIAAAPEPPAAISKIKGE